jgi:hypothetical protein
VTSGFYPSLLCYHYSDVVVATDRMHIAIVAYGLFLQWCAVVVINKIFCEFFYINNECFLIKIFSKQNRRMIIKNWTFKE